MKKLKYFILILVCIFSLSVNVFAESEKVIIKSMTPVYDEQSSIVVTNEGNNHNVKFNDKD